MKQEVSPVVLGAVVIIVLAIVVVLFVRGMAPHDRIDTSGPTVGAAGGAAKMDYYKKMHGGQLPPGVRDVGAAGGRKTGG